MTDMQARNREVLNAVRVRRDRLYEAILDLERALAVPAGGHPREWADATGAAVDRLGTVLESHVADTEADGGFFDDVRDHAPQLLHAVEQIQAEHGPLIEATAVVSARLGGVVGDADVDDVRDEAVELIRRLLRHRQRGVELVYDAYSVDVSAAD